MNDIDREELLRRALYHANEARRLLDEAYKRHEKAAQEFPDLNKWVCKDLDGPSQMFHPLCPICRQPHPSGIACPHWMTVS